MRKPKRELPGSVYVWYSPDMRRVLRERPTTVVVDPANVPVLATVLQAHMPGSRCSADWRVLLRERRVWIDGRRVEVRELPPDDPYRISDAVREEVASRAQRVIERTASRQK